MKMTLGMFASLFAMGSSTVWAEPAADNASVPALNAAPAASKRRGEVLDFEGDVIEGQKNAPDLFLQLDVQKPDLSSVLYDRKHFNDYHALDSKRRPRYSDPKMSQKTTP